MAASITAVYHWYVDEVWCLRFIVQHIASYNTVTNYKLQQQQYRNDKNNTGDKVDAWLIALYHY